TKESLHTDLFTGFAVPPNYETRTGFKRPIDVFATRTPLRPVLTNVCALISKFGTKAMWVSVAALSMELYPTVVRDIGYGLQNAIARIGAMIAPQALLL
ncbi:hypothetical protein CHS0354_008622, partial [Potamilus streckersoni]